MKTQKERLNEFLLVRATISQMLQEWANLDLEPFAVFCAMAEALEQFCDVHDESPIAEGNLREDLIHRLRTGSFKGDEKWLHS